MTSLAFLQWDYRSDICLLAVSLVLRTGLAEIQLTCIPLSRYQQLPAGKYWGKF